LHVGLFVDQSSVAMCIGPFLLAELEYVISSHLT